MADSKDLITFVLVRTQFAANLGSAARVMKNMGFRRLFLVDPRCEIGVEARTRAMKGAGILDEARIFPSLAEAARELNLLLGTSGVMPRNKKSLMSCRTMADQLMAGISGSVGVVFGSEEGGLFHSEIALCHWLVEIPTGSDYPSINLAQAVAILAYELHMSLSGRSPTGEDWLHKAQPAELQALSERSARVLSQEPFRHLSPKRISHRLSRIVARMQLESEDVKLLHQLLRKVESLAGTGGSKRANE